MTDKKDEAGLLSFDDIYDPAIAATLSEKEPNRTADKPKKKDGRGKPRHAGKLGQDKTGHGKVTYRISPARQELVRDIAKAEQVHHYDIVEVAIVAFVNAYRAGLVDLDPLKQSAASLKAAHTLEVPDDYIFYLNP